MALVVEDGTARTDAEAFASVAFFKQRHDARGATYSATDERIEQVLRLATDYMETRWGYRWVGERSTIYQALSWPRIGAYYPDGRLAEGVPIEVQRACVEYAFRALTETLAPDPSYDDIQAPVIEREERVGPIMEKRVYGGGGAQVSFRRFPIVDQSLKALLADVGYLKRV